MELEEVKPKDQFDYSEFLGKYKVIALHHRRKQAWCNRPDMFERESEWADENSGPYR